ncbi:AEC family transporter [Psychromarinibacter sp. C21-152]|uniref:AEC family transporter n=1 Tax=Psychromarinibacter sediminicola TaxID=3033385 RepID=A0AAE3T7U5_9RHOB|nr:AEC family transporter [Psychromarinibacter sediminicola]MDF0599394.1 AEC family transporter [Psychromarinibacter sediminicola]
MLQVLGITAPIFGAIAIGYAVTARGLFSPADMRVFGRYVLNIAFPALLFNAVATRELGDILHPGYLTAIAAGGLATMALTYAALSALGTGRARRAIAVLGVSMPNSAYIGYPIMLLALPERAGQVLALNFLVENFLILPIGLALLEFSRPQQGRGLLAVLGRILWQVLSKPFVIGLLLGLVVSLLQLPVPAPLTRLLEILATSASAIALVVIGGSLYGLSLRGNRALAVQIAIGKLALHPAMVALATLLIPALGLGLPADLTAAVILSAAMPMVAIYTVLAQPYGHGGIASIAMLLATTASFFTLSALLAVLF